MQIGALFRLVFVLWLVSLVGPAHGIGAMTLRYSLVDPNAIEGDGFGSQVAPVGATPDLLVSAPGEGYDPPLTGGAHLFDAGTGAVRRSFAGGATGDAFGTGAAAFGGFSETLGAHLVLGAPGADPSGTIDAGLAYVVDAQTGTTLQVLARPALLPATGFGAALVLDGASAIATDVFVGSSDDDAVYRFDATSGTLLATYVDPAGAPGFGTRLALSGSVILIASPNDGSGVVHEYDADTGLLLASLPNPSAAATGFGAAVLRLGSMTLIGAPEAPSGGAVHVFDSAGMLLTTWVNPDPMATGGFGAALTPFGPNVAVGAPVTGVEAGRVYVLDGTTGAVLDTVQNPDGFRAGFGASLAALRGSLAVGAPADASVTGAVHVFSPCGDGMTDPGEACDDGNTLAGDCCSPGCSLEATGNVCTLLTCGGPYRRARTFSGPNGPDTDGFGSRIGVTANGVVLTAPLDSSSGPAAGAAFIFDATTGDLLQSFANPAPGVSDVFGFSVAGDGSSVLFGAPFDVAAGQLAAGRVFVFDALTGALLQTLTRPGAPDAVGFGATLVMDGTAVVISAFDDAAAYRLDVLTGTPLTTFVDPTGLGRSFGLAAAISGNLVFLGSPEDGQGKVYAFDRTAGTLVHTYDAVDAGDYCFGSAVAARGNRLVIGSSCGDGGRAHVFDIGTTALVYTLSNPNPCETRHFGATLGFVGDHVIVGSPEDGGGGARGVAYLYDSASGVLWQTFPNPTPDAPFFGGAFEEHGGSVLIGSDGAAHVFAVCGDGTVNPGEGCDDGNPFAGDGCSPLCTLEPGGTTTTTSVSTTTTVAGSTTTTTLPPDPQTVATPLPNGVPANFAEATAFLWSGPTPIQQGVAPGTIQMHRAAVVRGRVRDPNGDPLSGVKVTVRQHPELGHTVSRTDGAFDLAVNGGGFVTLIYEKAGHPTVHRQIETPWRDFAVVPDVVMVPYDGQVTPVTLAGATRMIVARGSAVSDDDGTRQATMLFIPGTHATMELPGDVEVPLPAFNVRATEFTVGERGPRAMPADLPATSTYTYAVELSVDEAVAAGARTVRFSHPVIFYVEDIVGFPVGTTVPTGYYDRERAVWVPSENGKVVKVVAEVGGRARLDVTGDGDADPSFLLAAFGITDAEQVELATLYEPEQGLWRVPISHFTPWDHNWPGGPPPDDGPPSPPGPPGRGDGGGAGDGGGSGGGGGGKKGPEDCVKGSQILCESQALGEVLPLTGTPLSLHYRSVRGSGARTIDVPLSGPEATVPEPLKRIELEVTVAGQRHTESFEPLANQQGRFTWDGHDAYGRAMNGSAEAQVRIGYTYDAVFQRPASGEWSFGNVSGVRVEGDLSRGELTLYQEHRLTLHSWVPEQHGIGGWTLSAHHMYDAESRTLYLGDGSQRAAEALAVDKIAGQGTAGFAGDGGQAVDALFREPTAPIVAPDGSVLVSDKGNRRIRRIGRDGIVTTIAGNGSAAVSGEGGLATAASIGAPEHLALGPDGSLYFANAFTVHRIDPSGIFTRVAGNGNQNGSCSESAQLATNVALTDVQGLTVAPDGSVLISMVRAALGTWYLCRITPDGRIRRVMSKASGGLPLDGALSQAGFASIRTLAAGRDGAIVIVDPENQRVRRLGPDGFVTTLAGGGMAPGNGAAATSVSLSGPGNVAANADGSVLFLDGGRVRIVTADGVIRHVAGNGTTGTTGDGGAALQSQIRGRPSPLTPEGVFYVADSTGHRIRSVSSPLPTVTGAAIQIPSSDGREIFVFDAYGRHQQTVDAWTGGVRWTFGYDSGGRLATVTDGSDNTTEIQRAGNVASIVAPGGQTTTLTLTDGLVTSVANPAGETTELAYADGLLTAMTTPRDQTYAFDYDAVGRLVRDDDPAGGFQTLHRSGTPTDTTVTRVTALGRTTTYRTEQRGDGSTRKRVTRPGSGLTDTTIGPDGVTHEVAADGLVTTARQAPDPRFGMEAPYVAEEIVTTPMSRERVTIRTRTAAPLDPSSVLLDEETVTTINGHEHRRRYRNLSGVRTVTETSPANRVRVLTLDALGRVVGEQFGGLAPTTIEYNDGQVTRVTRTDGVTTRVFELTYDPLTRLLQSLTDPLLRQTGFGYDAASRVTALTLPGPRLLGFGYDDNGNVETVTPPGRPAHGFGYTPIDLEASYTPPDLGLGATTTSYGFDVDRQLRTVTRPEDPTGAPGIIITPEPTTGRIATMTTTAGTYSYTYLPSGQVATMRAPACPPGNCTDPADDVTLTLGYDGPLTTSMEWSGPIAGSVTMNYDDDFRVSGTAVNGEPFVVRGYDPDGLLTTTGAMTIARHLQHGLISGTTLGAGGHIVADTRDYTPYGELALHRTTWDGVERFKREYLTRDTLGRITEVRETINGGTPITYGYEYDAAGRLWRVRHDGVLVAEYTYDANGNRLTAPGLSTTPVYDAQDRLLAYDGATYTYTASGQLATKTAGGVTTTYTYDPLGNLRQVAWPGTTIEYVIDGLQRRVGKRVNLTCDATGGNCDPTHWNLVQAFLWEDQLRVGAELDGNGNVVARFIYGTGVNVPEYMVKAGVTYRLVTDHLGSVRQVIDVASPTGMVAQAITYDEWGRVLTDTAPGFQPFAFAGGLYDTETGYLRFGARDYDPSTGRWVSKDPTLFNGRDADLYVYAFNNPVNLVDPNGREAATAVATVGGVCLLSAEAAVAAAAGVGAIVVGAACYVYDPCRCGAQYQWDMATCRIAIDPEAKAACRANAERDREECLGGAPNPPPPGESKPTQSSDEIPQSYDEAA